MAPKLTDNQRHLLRNRAAFVRDMCEEIIRRIDERKPLPAAAVDRANAMFVAAIQGTTKGKVDVNTLARRAIVQSVRYGLEYREFYDACFGGIHGLDGKPMPGNPLDETLGPSAIGVKSLLIRTFGLEDLPIELCIAALQAADSKKRRREAINALFSWAGLEPISARTERQMWDESPKYKLIPRHPLDTVGDVIRRHLGLKVKARGRRM